MKVPHWLVAILCGAAVGALAAGIAGWAMATHKSPPLLPNIEADDGAVYPPCADPPNRVYPCWTKHD